MTKEDSNPFFAPQLFIPNGVKDISFYEKAFGAKEQLRFSDEDGSLHVAELSIEGAIFHLHEITASPHFFSPGKYNGTTVLIGLFVPDVDAVMTRAIKAGATEIKPAKDYEYGYRQGEIKRSVWTSLVNTEKDLKAVFPGTITYRRDTWRHLQENAILLHL